MGASDGQTDRGVERAEATDELIREYSEKHPIGPEVARVYGRAGLTPNTQPQSVLACRSTVVKADRRCAVAQSPYGLRKQVVEPVFGIIKQALGFRQFLLRGKDKAGGEWDLVCMAYNLKRMHVMAA